MEPANQMKEKDLQRKEHRKYCDSILGVHGDWCHLNHDDRRALTLNVLLLGEKQSGRSSVGNAIIGGLEFNVGLCLSGSALTQDCHLRCRTFRKFFRRQGEETDLRLRVLDTPPCPRPPGELREAVRAHFPEGVHVIVLVLRADVTYEDAQLTQLAQCMQTLLGPQWAGHTLLVLTHTDRMREAGLRQSHYITQASDSLRRLIDSMGGGLLFLDNSSDWPEITGKPLRDKLLHLSARNKHSALSITL